MPVENAEKIQPGTVAPAPSTTDTPASVPANSAAAVPAESPAVVQDRKVTAAFIAQRQRIKELERAQAAAPVAPVPSPAPAPAPEQAKIEAPTVPPAPIPAKIEGIQELEKLALHELSADKDLAKIPGSVMDVLTMIDSDVRLKRLYSEIDPALAIREAKNLYLANAGIAAPVPTPNSAPTSGGMSSGEMSLEALITECEKHRPGTKEFNLLSKKVQAEMNKLQKL